jgi:hypothetical protein
MSLSNKLFLPNVSTAEEYYFIPKDNQKEIININYPHTVKIVGKDMSKIEKDVELYAIPSATVWAINPGKDFNFKVIVNDKYCFTSYPLSKILTDNTYKYPNLLTHAFITCGEECIDLGKEILINTGVVIIPKFTDEKIMEKLNKAINDAFWSSWHASDFTLEYESYKMKVVITVSDELREKIRKNIIGPFTIPCEKEVKSEEQ